MSFLDEFRQKMQESGIYPDGSIEVTGKIIKRIKAKGDKRGTLNIAYWFVDEGGLAYGWFMHWGKTDGIGWVSKSWSKINSEKRKEIQTGFEEAKKQEEEKRNQQYEQIAIEAYNIWNNAEPYQDHPALTNKGFILANSNESIKRELNRLKIKTDDLSVLIPVRDEKGKLWTLQRLLRKIDVKPNKKFLKGGRSGGCFYVIGGKFEDLSGEVAVVEGFTTGLSVYLALNIPVIVTFSADNLFKVCSSKFMLEKGVQFIICGDDDRFNTKNAGRIKATDARDKLGCKLVFPVFKNLEKEPTDWNDLYLLEGLDEVREQINKAHQFSAFSDMPLEKLSEKEKPIYVVNSIISKIDTCFNELYTRKSFLKLKGDKKVYECNTHEFFVKILGEYKEIFGELTNKHKEISKLIEYYLKTEENNVVWVESSKPVYKKGNKVFFKTDLKGYPIYEIDKDGFRVSTEKDYTAFKDPINKEEDQIKFKISNETATIQELEMFFSVKGMDLLKIFAFCISSILSDEKYILGIFGPFQCGKDTLQIRIGEIISPLEDFKNTLQNTKKDLMVVSSQTFINGYSNISYLSKDYQDYFCLLVTGASDSSRKLFSDNSVVNIRAQTPIILNGINNIIEREDLLSRMTIINLEPMSSNSRVVFKDESLKEIQGKVQNFIFTMISWFLKNIDAIKIQMAGKTRTQKLRLWMLNCSKYAGMDFTLEDFIKDYEEEVVENIMSNPIYMAIENYLYKTNDRILTGSITDVWDRLKRFADMGSLKNLHANQFMREINRMDFSKTPINFVKLGRLRINRRQANSICFEVKI